MRALIQRKIRQVESWIDDEADWGQVADDCRSILREVERRAVTAGNPAIVELTQARGGGLKHTRKTLAACLAVLDAAQAQLGDAEYLTVQQAADRYQLGPRTIYRMVEDGKVKAHRAGKAIRIRRVELERHLAGRESLFR